MYYIYIIRCKNNLLYTGITTDVSRRLGEHLDKSGKGAKFTRANPPLELSALWSCETRSDALKLEAKIKKLKREEKVKIINDLSHPFPCSVVYKREGKTEVYFQNIQR